MKNLILLRMLVVCVAVGSVPFAFAESPDKDAALDTIAQINHLNWVFNTIKTYNNALVLEEEYNKISPGHLNLNRIPDQEAMGRITSIRYFSAVSSAVIALKTAPTSCGLPILVFQVNSGAK